MRKWKEIDEPSNVTCSTSKKSHTDLLAFFQGYEMKYRGLEANQQELCIKE